VSALDCLTPRTVRRTDVRVGFDRFCDCAAPMVAVACLDGAEADCIQTVYRCARGHEWMETWEAEGASWAPVGGAEVDVALCTPSAHLHLPRREEAR
jgi:hypothetical protein